MHDPTALYQGLADATRLRLLHLLWGGPLCVCHLQDTLALEQVTVSKHLGYLKRLGLVEVEPCGAWRVYRWAPAWAALLTAHFAALRQSAFGATLAEDHRRCQAVLAEVCPPAEVVAANCCAPRGRPALPEPVRVAWAASALAS